MNITKNLFKAVVLALWLTPALSSCTADDDINLPDTDDARTVAFDIPKRTLCGGAQTRVSQEEGTAKWEVNDVLYIYATFTIPNGNSTTTLNKVGVLKKVYHEDPQVDYWKYVTENEMDYSITSGLENTDMFQTPLRWPINATKGDFLIVYAGSKAGYSTSAKLKFSDKGINPDGSSWYGSLVADVGTESLAGQVDVMRTSIKDVKAGTSVVLPPFKHLLTRLRVTGGGAIYAGDRYSRIATVAAVNLYTGMVTSVVETGVNGNKLFVKDKKDYFAIVNRQQYNSVTAITADGKVDDLEQSIFVTVKPDGANAYTRVLVRPVVVETGKPLPYAGTTYNIVKPTPDQGTTTPGNIGITPDQPEIQQPAP